MSPLIDTSLTNEFEALGRTANEGNRSYANDAQVPGLIADGRQAFVAARDASASFTNSDLPGTTCAIRNAADGTSGAMNRAADAAVLASTGGLVLGAVNTLAVYKQSCATLMRARVRVAEYNLALQASVQGSTGQDRASWIVDDAISIVNAILRKRENSESLRPMVLLIGDYHDTYASTWHTINDRTRVNAQDRALFPENQLDCLVTTLPEAIQIAVSHLTSCTQSSEKATNTGSPHFFFLLRGHGDIQFAQTKQRHKAVIIPHELSKCVSIIGRGGHGDSNAHALHMDSKIEKSPRDFVPIFREEGIFWYVDAWRSGVSLYRRGKERLGRGTGYVGGAGSLASVASAWGIHHALHIGVLLAGTALVIPGAALYGAGEVVSRTRFEDYTLLEARSLLTCS